MLDLESGAVRLHRPSKVMHRRDYYRQTHAPAGADEFLLEKGFDQTQERHLPGIIAKLTENRAALTEFDFVTFTNYLVFQRLRVPRQDAALKRAALDAGNSLLKRWPGIGHSSVMVA